MKTMIIAELVKFQATENTSNEQVLQCIDALNAFQKTQDGFLDSEITKSANQNEWVLIYHYTDMEKVNALGPKLRVSHEFAAFMQIIVPGSLSISFYQQVKKW